VVYVVHVGTLNEAMVAAHGTVLPFSNAAATFLQPDAPSIIDLFNRRTALLDRMIVQQSVFMVCRNIGADVEQVLGTQVPKVSDPKKTTLIRLRIPAAEKPIIMRRLRSMNVTASSLFPGLDGIGRQLDETIRNTR